METAVGVVVGALITLLISRYYFRRSTSRSLAVYRLLNSLVFSGIAPDVRRQLQFLFNTREVAELQQLVFLVANDGEKPIRDVIEPLSLQIPPEVEVLDASIVHRQPEVLRADVVAGLPTPQGTVIRFEFPLLNKREFFVVKLLLSGAFRLEKSRFRILSDDLPRTVPISELPYSAFREVKRETEWGLAVAGAVVLGMAGWLCYSAYELRSARPELFPFPWHSFVISARSLSLLIPYALLIGLFLLLGLLMLGSSLFGGNLSLPPQPRFPLPNEILEAVLPHGFMFATEPEHPAAREIRRDRSSGSG